jgi:hypothetical protein
MRHPLVRASQLLTAAAALFTVLWACGRAPTQPSRVESTLDGTWEGSLNAPSTQPVSATLTLTTNGRIPSGTLRAGGVTYETDQNRQTPVDPNVVVTLYFRATPTVTLVGQISDDNRQMTGTVTGLAAGGQTFVLVRR